MVSLPLPCGFALLLLLSRGKVPFRAMAGDFKSFFGVGAALACSDLGFPFLLGRKRRREKRLDGAADEVQRIADGPACSTDCGSRMRPFPKADGRPFRRNLRILIDLPLLGWLRGSPQRDWVLESRPTVRFVLSSSLVPGRLRKAALGLFFLDRCFCGRQHP